MEGVLEKKTVTKFAKSQGSKTAKLEIYKNFIKPPNSFTVSEKHMLYEIFFVVIFHSCLKLAGEWFLLII